MEKPELRHFNLRPDDLLRENRGAYVGAILTALRGYLLALQRGDPMKDDGPAMRICRREASRRCLISAEFETVRWDGYTTGGGNFDTKHAFSFRYHERHGRQNRRVAARPKADLTTRLTMSVLEGTADTQAARPDFSV